MRGDIKFYIHTVIYLSQKRSYNTCRRMMESSTVEVRAGSHYRLFFILAGSKKKVTQPEIKIKLTTLGSHFNQLKIKRRQSRRQSHSRQVNIPAN